MNYTIQNDKISVVISDKGAEIQSIFGKKSGHEYLWQANVEGLWKSRATVLFPICGRLFNGKYTYSGKEYEMPIHGFVKLFNFKVTEQTAEKIVFEFKNNEETLKMYPFKFIFKVIYTLDGATVRNEFYVENAGNPDLPFSIGGHPGFALPLENGLNFDDHYIEFEPAEKRSRIDMSKNCLYLGSSTDYPMENDNIIRLKHSLFADDAIFLSGKNGSATLKSDKSNKFVKLTFRDITHVGLWQTYDEKTNFVCIEPWHGIPAFEEKTDDFATKNEFIHLKDGENYTFSFDISVSE